MVTRKDVAERAGVSVTIVSRTLNESGYVAKDKKAAVLKAAKELGYRPSPIALSLKSQRTRQILFISKDLENNFNMELYGGMMEYARRHDYMMLFSGALEFEKLSTLMIDGVIFANEAAAEQYVLKNIWGLKLPVVSAGFGSPLNNAKNVPYIDCDTYQGIEMMIEYLRAKGHEKIALASPYELYCGQPRHTAYVSQMRPVLGNRLEEYFFSAESKNDVYELEEYRQEGERAAKIFMERKSDATAIMCFNDDFAIGLCDYFHRHGVRVPEDVSVTGVDGLKIGRYFRPRLTTIAMEPAKQGAECVRVLLELIEGRKVKMRTTLPIYLQEGESVLELGTGGL